MKKSVLPIFLLLTLLIASCTTTDPSTNNRNPDSYLSQHPDVDPAIKEAILKGIVIEGMCPNEAIAAAGSPGPYYVKKDPKWGPGVPPPTIIMAQCENPDNSIIELMFRNKTQFDSNEPITFRVKFVKGKAVLIDQKGFNE